MADVFDNIWPYNFFDPGAPVARLSGQLPHWRPDGVIYFVTFRCADSLPQSKLHALRIEREAWRTEHPEPHTAEERKEYYERFVRRIEAWLDQGAGACRLARPDLREHVETTLRFFNGTHYRLDEFVVMPNHVHVLVTPLGKNRLSEILKSWKSFSGKAINRKLGRSGPFWQKESFDHIVRNAESLQRFRRYIRDNPKNWKGPQILQSGEAGDPACRS